MLALLLVGSLAVSAPVPKAVKKADDAKLILGDWKGGTLNGAGVSSGEYTFRFTDDGICGIGHGKQTPSGDCAYTLDPSATPLKEMKWLNGAVKTEWRCVYELDGDTLRVGFVHQNKATPTTMTPSGDLTVYELKRVKPEK